MLPTPNQRNQEGQNENAKRNRNSWRGHGASPQGTQRQLCPNFGLSLWLWLFLLTPKVRPRGICLFLPMALLMTPTFLHIFTSPLRSTPQLLSILSRRGWGVGGWVGGGGGGRNNVPCACKHVSCYAMTSSLALAARCHATLWHLLALAPRFHATLWPWHLLLHLQPGVMLPYGGWGGVITSLALANMFHATLWHLLLRLHPGATSISSLEMWMDLSETTCLRLFVPQTGATQTRWTSWLNWPPHAETKKSVFFQTPVLHMDAKHGWSCEFIASKSCRYHRKWMMVFQSENRNLVLAALAALAALVALVVLVVFSVFFCCYYYCCCWSTCDRAEEQGSEQKRKKGKTKKQENTQRSEDTKNQNKQK